MITNEELTNVLRAYRAGSVTKALFRKCIFKIVEEVFQHPSYHFNISDPSSMIREATNMCVAKANKFDEQRGKAINFFVTLAGCYIRQEKGLQKYKARIKLQETSIY